MCVGGYEEKRHGTGTGTSFLYQTTKKMSQMRCSIQKVITIKGMRAFANPEGFMPNPMMNMLRALVVKCLAQKQRMF